jgi:hypothetical protein
MSEGNDEKSSVNIAGPSESASVLITVLLLQPIPVKIIQE